jgi:hypothetical protein
MHHASVLPCSKDTTIALGLEPYEFAQIKRISGRCISVLSYLSTFPKRLFRSRFPIQFLYVCRVSSMPNTCSGYGPWLAHPNHVLWKVKGMRFPSFCGYSLIFFCGGGALGILHLFLNACIVFFSKGDSSMCVVPWGRCSKNLPLLRWASSTLYTTRVFIYATTKSCFWTQFRVIWT